MADPLRPLRAGDRLRPPDPCVGIGRARQGPCACGHPRTGWSRGGTRQEAPIPGYPDINGDPEEIRHAVLSPYLFDAGGLANPHLTVREESAPVNGLPKLIIGFQANRRRPLHLRDRREAPGVSSRRNRRQSRTCGPTSAPVSTCKAGAGGFSLCTMSRPMSWRGCHPYGIGSQRCVPTARPAGARRPGSWPRLRRCMTSTSSPPPTSFVVPEVSSERREYVPIGFPTPTRWASNDRLESLAQAVLDARAAYPNATLADLYDPDLMPPALRRAHQALDRAVDRLYRSRGFVSERERAEHLFMLYEKMRAPLGVGSQEAEAAATMSSADRHQPAAARFSSYLWESSSGGRIRNT